MGAGLGSPSPDVEAVVAQFGAFQNSCSEDCAAFLLPEIVCQRPWLSLEQCSVPALLPRQSYWPTVLGPSDSDSFLGFSGHDAAVHLHASAGQTRCSKQASVAANPEVSIGKNRFQHSAESMAADG